MQPDRLRRLSELFDSAVEMSDADAEAFVAAQSREDADLAAELARLLAKHRALAGTSTLSAVEWTEAREAHIADAGLAPGSLLGPWRLLGEIGHGGMGRVFRAERADGAYTREVAIKVLRRELIDPQLLRRFSTERDVLAALDHPNIARLLDAAAMDDGTPYVVMELVAGEGLLEWCDAHALAPAERVRMFRQIVEAVAHAHRQLVVHRDIKPSNVLVTHEGVPKLLDFGIAKPLAFDAKAATVTAERYFTPASAAPEQLRGETIGVACDVYALGLLLYELLAGKPPFAFDGLTPGQAENLVCNVPPPALATVVPDDADAARRHGCRDARAWRATLRGDLEAIVQRALRKEPRGRYATVERFDADLDAWLERRPVEARGGQTAYRLRKFVARHRALVALGSAAAIALAATGATILQQNRALERERDRVALERDRAEQVVDLLQQSFEAADPGRTGGKVDASAILVAAQARLPALAHQPELLAELAEVLVRVEMGVGMSKDAAATATQAVAALAGADPQRLAHMRLLQARALVSAGDYPAAERALAQAAQELDTASPEFLAVRGSIHAQLNRPEEAIADLQDALPKVADRPPTDSTARAVRWRLIDALLRAERADEALALADRMLQWQQASDNTLPVDIARTQVRRANLLFRLQRYDEAAALGEATLPEFVRLYGADSPLTASARMSLANAYKHTGRRDDALREYRAAEATYVRAAGPDHPHTQMARYNLAMFLAWEQGDVREAEAVFTTLVATVARTLPPTDTMQSTFREEYARWLGARGRPLDGLSVILAHAAAPGLEGVGEKQAGDLRALAAELREQAGCERPQAPGSPAAAMCGGSDRLVATGTRP